MSAPAKLDEKALRRPEFSEGVPITLSDGQDWTFPRPMLGDYYFRPGPDGRPEVASGYAFGPAYEDLVDRYVEADTGLDEMLALAALAIDLLARNYALTLADARPLLRLKLPDDPGKEANRAMWGAIEDVALGVAPKPTPVGSGPPSAPTG